MKGKILSVLFSLMLVFGMIFAACDNGVQPDDPYKSDPSKGKALDYTKAGQGYANYDLDDSDPPKHTGTHPNAYNATGEQTGDNVLNATEFGLGLW
jgi:hypothetical protein